MREEGDIFIKSKRWHLLMPFLSNEPGTDVSRYDTTQSHHTLQPLLLFLLSWTWPVYARVKIQFSVVKLTSIQRIQPYSFGAIIVVVCNVRAPCKHVSKYSMYCPFVQ
jgi:hypothetical protein